MGADIVCFAKDWSEDPTSNNHVMRLLARDNEVLWLNSIATRSPSFSSGRDLTKIERKLRSFAHGPERVTPGLRVFTPLVLPFPHARAAVTLNRAILRATIASLRRGRPRDFQLWSFLPTATDYMGFMGESLRVYYCTDEWSQFTYVDGPRVAKMEEELCRKADLVFTTSHALFERRRAWNTETHLALHGVDVDHFARALDERTLVADGLAGAKRPILGFFGLIQDWIDLELIGWLAEQRPEWTIAMIGNVVVDNARWAKQKNVLWLGRRPYEELPHYCKAFSVGLIPFVVNELTRSVNPIKLREYVSAGLPVVSTPLPECARMSAWCSVAKTREEFLAACERAIASDSPDARRKRSEAMRAESWEQKVRELGEHVARVSAAKRRS